MTESNEIEFHEKVGKPRPHRRATRIGIVVGGAALVVIGAVTAMAASPAPSTGADPAASSAPGTTTPSAKPADGVKGAFGLRDGRVGAGGFHEITITAISGSDLSLKTDDGWTRTITVTASTTVTKGGATIALGELAVGDQIRFAQQRADDGTYTITAIVVVLPTIVGEVTAIDGNTLTVTQRGGTTATIHVDGDTTYRVNGTAGSLSDIKVGSIVVAEGTQRTDGSLDAARVGTGFGDRAGRGPGFPHRHDGQKVPGASPAPSSGAS